MELLGIRGVGKHAQARVHGHHAKKGTTKTITVASDRAKTAVPATALKIKLTGTSTRSYKATRVLSLAH
jgi:hypothetical protein